MQLIPTSKMSVVPETQDFNLLSEAIFYAMDGTYFWVSQSNPAFQSSF